MLSDLEARLHPVYRIRPGTRTDPYGNTVDDWRDPERTLLRGAAVRSPSSTESGPMSAEQLRNTRRLYAAAPIDLRAGDRVEAEGVVWEVDGEPRVRRGLTGTVSTTADLIRFERRG